jgi:putative addiction module component (TIGR02574 family)
MSRPESRRHHPSSTTGSPAVEEPGLFALTDAQREELRRRAAAHEADPSSAIPWESVRALLVPR